MLTVKTSTGKARTPSKRRAKENISDLCSPRKKQTTFRNSPATAHHRLSSKTSSPEMFPPSPGMQQYGTDRTRFLAAVANTTADLMLDSIGKIGVDSPRLSLLSSRPLSVSSAFRKVGIGDSDSSSTVAAESSDSDSTLDDGGTNETSCGNQSRHQQRVISLTSTSSSSSSSSSSGGTKEVVLSTRGLRQR